MRTRQARTRRARHHRSADDASYPSGSHSPQARPRFRRRSYQLRVAAGNGLPVASGRQDLGRGRQRMELHQKRLERFPRARGDTCEKVRPIVST